MAPIDNVGIGLAVRVSVSPTCHAFRGRTALREFVHLRRQREGGDRLAGVGGWANMGSRCMVLGG